MEIQSKYVKTELISVKIIFLIIPLSFTIVYLPIHIRNTDNFKISINIVKKFLYEKFIVDFN